MIIYFAGMEQADGMPLVKKGLIGNAFLSYYHLRSRATSDRMLILRKNIQSIIVDSGAHSFFSETDRSLSASVVVKKTKTKGSPEEYFAKYKEWLIAFQDKYNYFVELDIGELVGQAKVLQWREELKKLGLFKKCITVMHPKVVHWQDYLKMLDESESKYIALEGDRPNRPRLPYNRYIKPAYEKGLRVHGFAMTKEDAMLAHPFNSVDSTSWKAGALYGRTKVHTKKGLKVVNFKDREQCFNINNYSNDLHSVNLEKNRVSRYELSVEAYKRLEAYVTKVWKSRGVNT